MYGAETQAKSGTGIDPGLVGKGAHWRTPTQGAMNDFIVKHALIPGWPTDYPSVRDRLTALDKAGLVHWGRENAQP